MTLAESLDTLVLEHDRIGSPLRERLTPGVPRDRVAEAVRALGLSPPSDLLELFAWHDIRDEPAAGGRVDWFWSAAPFHLDEATTSYLRAIAIGGVTPADLDEVIRAGLPPGATFTGFWRTDWFPELFRAGAYRWDTNYNAVTTADDVFVRLGLGRTMRPWP